MPSSEPSLQRDWVAYYNAVQGRPPRETLLRALQQFEQEPSETPRFAVDLGCGDGRDTIALLERGWRVLAMDGEPRAIDRLLHRPDLVNGDRLETQIVRFESLTLPPDLDLINGSFCLPFCPPVAFSTFWATLVTSLRVGGRLCGQLFGDRDSWAVEPAMTHHTREQVMELLQPFEVEWLEEEEHPGTTALGQEKHWHIFHIVACKKAA